MGGGVGWGVGGQHAISLVTIYVCYSVCHRGDVQECTYRGHLHPSMRTSHHSIMHVFVCVGGGEASLPTVPLMVLW